MPAGCATVIRLVTLALASLLGPTAGSFSGVWQQVGEQKSIPDPYARGISQPSVRYSHSAVVWKDSMIVTHGYFYNRNVKPSAPAWLHDTWSFSFKTHRWTIMNEGKGLAPSPRYGHSAFVYEGSMYLFGGDDGDHRASPTNYRSHHFVDLWRFDLSKMTWSEVKEVTGPKPPPRSLHASALIGDKFVVYAGLSLNDTRELGLTWMGIRGILVPLPPTGLAEKNQML